MLLLIMTLKLLIVLFYCACCGKVCRVANVSVVNTNSATITNIKLVNNFIDCEALLESELGFFT